MDGALHVRRRRVPRALDVTDGRLLLLAGAERELRLIWICFALQWQQLPPAFGDPEIAPGISRILAGELHLQDSAL